LIFNDNLSVNLFIDIKCAILAPDYFYVSNFSAGPSGIQPHNFILHGGEYINITNYAVPTGDEFDWYNKTEFKRNYEQSGKNIIINTKGANFEITFIKKTLPPSDEQIKIDSFLLVPWKQNNLSQLININTMGKKLN